MTDTARLLYQLVGIAELLRLDPTLDFATETLDVTVDELRTRLDAEHLALLLEDDVKIADAFELFYTTLPNGPAFVDAILATLQDYTLVQRIIAGLLRGGAVIAASAFVEAFTALPARFFDEDAHQELVFAMLSTLLAYRRTELADALLFVIRRNRIPLDTEQLVANAAFNGDIVTLEYLFDTLLRGNNASDLRNAQAAALEEAADTNSLAILVYLVERRNIAAYPRAVVAALASVMYNQYEAATRILLRANTLALENEPQILAAMTSLVFAQNTGILQALPRGVRTSLPFVQVILRNATLPYLVVLARNDIVPGDVQIRTLRLLLSNRGVANTRFERRDLSVEALQRAFA